MSEYDQAFDPNILIGHCDLISRFSDFALYLDTQLVYFRLKLHLKLKAALLQRKQEDIVLHLARFMRTHSEIYA